MRAAVYDRFGAADVLEVLEIDDRPWVQTPSWGGRAMSANPVDSKVREGYLASAFPRHFPIDMGWDVAGVVGQVRPAVQTGLQVGDEVSGYVRRDDVAFATAAELVPAP